jgi:hypothetical protein
MRFLRRSKSSEESERALEDAQKHLSEVQKRGPEVSSVANSLKDFREKNHLMEKFEEIFIIKKVQSNDS